MKITTVPPTPSKPDVQITLTHEELKFLHEVLGTSSLDVSDERRKFIASFYSLLNDHV